MPVIGGLASGLTLASEDDGAARDPVRGGARGRARAAGDVGVGREATHGRDLSGMFCINVLVT
jgi:hypothetical protein